MIVSWFLVGFGVLCLAVVVWFVTWLWFFLGFLGILVVVGCCLCLGSLWCFEFGVCV